MATWILIWLLLLLFPVLFLVFVIGLALRAVDVGRSARRFGEEAGPITAEISAGAQRAASRRPAEPQPGNRRFSARR